jgi:hypothetical protein
MASLGTTTFRGRSGKQYRFRVFPLGTRFRKISGVYVVACRAHGTTGGYQYTALLAGHSEDFSRPFAEHPQAPECARQGANCICVLKDGSEESRLAKQQDIFASLERQDNN